MAQKCEFTAEVRLRELEVEAMWAGSRRQSPEFYVSRNISLVFSCGGSGKIALGKKNAWPLLLQCVLVGKAQDAYLSLS